jgi:phosphate/sulfate permease
LSLGAAVVIAAVLEASGAIIAGGVVDTFIWLMAAILFFTLSGLLI